MQRAERRRNPQRNAHGRHVERRSTVAATSWPSGSRKARSAGARAPHCNKRSDAGMENSPRLSETNTDVRAEA
ncbi:hypothetical protein NDU88_009475 [Pleurodeles waltl]|uniref:Uncharacterized protein n=1 Tax=Pleurodeles waltl TaxID=8319 RepID=A0AAV7P6Q1_PLEWA|nr:hypothetical protein NDU88_009475 [Pleurodeles waltl]